MNDKLPSPSKTPGEARSDEPILPKQRALLEFLKLPVPPTRGGASNLIKSVFEGLSGNAHQKAWEVAKYKLYPTLYPAASKGAAAPKPRFASPLSLVLAAVLIIGLCCYAWLWLHQDSDDSNTSDATILTMPVPGVGYVIPLESIDGRTISATILALTKETVLIRRVDGQTFDLPLDRLTPESKQRIEEYRAAKRSGLTH